MGSQRNNLQLGQGRGVHPTFFMFYGAGLNLTQRLHIFIGPCSVIRTLTFRFMRKFTHLHIKFNSDEQYYENQESLMFP